MNVDYKTKTAIRLDMTRNSVDTRKQASRLGLFRSAFLMMVVLVGVSFYRLFLEARKSVFFGGRVNLVLSRPFMVASFDEQSGSLTLVPVPKEILMNLPFGMRGFRAETVANLGVQEGKGEAIVVDAIELTWGILVDGWLGEGGDVGLGFEVGEGKKIVRIPILKRLGWLVNSRGSISLWDRIRLLRKVSKVRPDRLVILDVENSTLGAKGVDPDGHEVISVDPDKAVAVFSGLFSDLRIVEEGFTVSVLNGTGYPGLAHLVGAMLKTSGVRVVFEGEASGLSARCEVRTMKGLAKSYTAVRIMKWLKCDRIVETDTGRNDIEVIAGTKLGEYMMGEMGF